MKRQVRDSGSKPGLRQRRQLHLAVAVGEEGEHEEAQPVRRAFVECAQHAGRVRIAGVPPQQFLGFLRPSRPKYFCSR